MSVRNMEQARRIYDVRDRINRIRDRLSHIVESPGDKPAATSELNDVEALLESLPLATAEFGLAIDRVRNVKRYLQSDELGAAKFELTLLLGSLLRKRYSPICEQERSGECDLSDDRVRTLPNLSMKCPVRNSGHCHADAVDVPAEVFHRFFGCRNFGKRSIPLSQRPT